MCEKRKMKNKITHTESHLDANVQWNEQVADSDLSKYVNSSKFYFAHS